MTFTVPKWAIWAGGAAVLLAVIALAFVLGRSSGDETEGPSSSPTASSEGEEGPAEEEEAGEPSPCTEEAAAETTSQKDFRRAHALYAQGGPSNGRIIIDPRAGFQIAALTCADLTGDGLDEMAYGLSGGASANIFIWALFSPDGEGGWRLEFSRHGQQIYKLRAEGSSLFARAPVFKPGDGQCCPSGFRTIEVAYQGGEFAVPFVAGSAASRLIQIQNKEVISLGDFLPGVGSPADAKQVFGKPTTTQDDGEICPATWADLGLTIYFADLGGGDACSRSGRVGSIEIRGAEGDDAGWHTAGDISIGSTLAEARKVFPDAEVGYDGVVLLDRPSPYFEGERTPTLTVETADDRIAAMTLSIGAAGE